MKTMTTGRSPRALRRSSLCKKPARPSPRVDGMDLLDLPDDLLLQIMRLVDNVDDKRELRLTCRRLWTLTSLTITQIAINEAMHKELTGPRRRNALVLQLAQRLPALTTATVEYLPCRGLLPRILHQLPSLTDLEAGDRVVSPAAAAALAACPRLRSLTLVLQPTTLPALPPLPAINHLNLFLHYRPARPPRDLTPLTRYPTLASLSLHHLPDPHPDPHFLAPLAALPHLRALHFCSFTLPDPPSPGFVLTHLTHLTLLSAPATGTHTLASIPHLTALQELSLCGPPAPHDLELWAAAAPHLPALQTLSCYFAMIAPPARITTPALSHLHIHELPRTPLDAPLLNVTAALSQMLPLSRLHTLHLHTSPLPAHETCGVLQLLAKDVPHIQDLNLDGTFCQAAVQSLRRLTALQALTLHAWLKDPAEVGVVDSLEGLRFSLPHIHSFRLLLYRPQ